MRYLALCCSLLAGCAAVQGSPCASAYEAGRTDAQFGRRPAYDAYARACPGQASEGDYLAGWSIGYSETSFRQPN